MEENHRRGDSCYTSSSKMAVANMVSNGNKLGKKSSLVQKEARESFPIGKDIDYRRLTEYPAGSMPLLDQNLKEQGFGNSVSEESLEEGHKKDLFKLFETMGTILRTF